LMSSTLMVSTTGKTYKKRSKQWHTKSSQAT